MEMVLGDPGGGEAELLGVADQRRVVAIGDSPHTDLAGAQAAGLDAVWALTGLRGAAFPLLLILVVASIWMFARGAQRRGWLR